MVERKQGRMKEGLKGRREDGKREEKRERAW